jgi:hypothetical protein
MQILGNLSKIRPLRQRRFLGKLPVLADSLDQLAQSILSVPESCAHAVLNHPAFEIDRLPGRCGSSIPAMSLSTHLIS